ncbi:MAG: hypothetical protein WC900_10655 [Oscillospiraceae bacterium]|jgi:hypothetical protein
MSFYRLIILVVASSLLFGSSAQAVGIGVKPKKIDLNVVLGKEIKTEILIINVSDEPAMYQVYPDSLKQEIKVSPSDFTLDPSASQLVEIKVKMKSPGLFATNISAVARPLGSGGLVAASGVKIPFTASVSGWPVSWFIIGFIFVCFAIVFMLLLIKRRKKNIKN